MGRTSIEQARDRTRLLRQGHDLSPESGILLRFNIDFGGVPLGYKAVQDAELLSHM